MPNVPDAIVLCGGAGTRLRSVTGEAPKSLATIGDRPCLELLLRQLRRHGFQRAILAVGYQRDLIRSHLGDRACGVTLDIPSSQLRSEPAAHCATPLIWSRRSLFGL